MKLVLKPHQNLFFTSDTHYNHKNICSGTSEWGRGSNLTRKFDTLDEMNSNLVDNINSVVGEDDILVHLGDWSFGGFDSIEEFRNRIICREIHLVLGNHDHHIQRNKNGIQRLFTSVSEYLYLNVSRPNGGKTDKFSFVCMHYPISSWNNMNRGVPHLHGHVHLPHDLRVSEGKAMDVGVDGNHLTPISLDEILGIMLKQPISSLKLPKDHHVEET